MAEPSAAPLSVDLDPVRLVEADGSPTSETRYSRDLPPETLGWLYESMVVTRDLDSEFVNLQRQGELALFASCHGQEAAQVGAAACLRKTDWLFPQYREIGAFLLRGITRPRSVRCGAANGTVACSSPTTASPRSRSPSVPTAYTRSAPRWPRSASVRIP